MTLEELLECSATQLQALSDDELTSYLSKYFIVTRPDQAKRQHKVSQSPLKSLQNIEQERKMKRAAEIAKQFGIELNL